jgi:hypothetical protein
MLAVGQFRDTYDGPAYAERANKQELLRGRMIGEALICFVELGAGPDCVAYWFGHPTLSSRDNAGPISWFYPEYGVTVNFPVRMFKPAHGVTRVIGGLE